MRKECAACLALPASADELFDLCGEVLYAESGERRDHDRDGGSTHDPGEVAGRDPAIGNWKPVDLVEDHGLRLGGELQPVEDMADRINLFGCVAMGDVDDVEQRVRLLNLFEGCTKAATTVGGSFWMNPTVSVSSASRPEGSVILRVTGSRVEKSCSRAVTPAPVSLLSRVLLPALVYPTRDMTGICATLRLFR